MLYALWALAGWCGTVPRRWPFPPGPGPGDPWWFVSRLIGAAFGILGGWLYTQAFAGPTPQPAWDSPIAAAASAFGAFLVGRFVTDIAGRFGNRADQVQR